MAKHMPFLLLGAACLLLSIGCGQFGKVSQGRVIEYDSAKGLATLISQSEGQDPSAPKYGVLPPITIQVPDNPKQMGPAPQTGKLMFLDSRNRKVVIFDTRVQSFRELEYRLVAQRDNVFADDPAIKGRGFPQVDRTGKTVTAYSSEKRQLVTFAVPDEYIELPADTWRTGDEIRYYYKDPRKALRLMNVTKTTVQ